MSRDWTLARLLTLDEGNGPDAPLSHAAVASALRARLPVVEGVALAPLDPADPLTDDVRMLGALFGQVLVEHEGEAFYGAIERMRRRARGARREGGPDWKALDAVLSEALGDASPREAVLHLTRTASAFRLILALIGIAEKVHQPAGPFAVDATLASLSDQAGAVRESLDRIEVRLVATAHPTKILRQRILAHQRRIDRLLRDLHQPQPDRQTQVALLEHLAEGIEVLWATQFSRWERPTVSDEIDHVMTYFERGLIDATLGVERTLSRSVAHRLGAPLAKAARPRLHFGSWVGGDMDGNPYVTPQVFTEALEKQRRVALHHLSRVTAELAPRLSHAAYRVPATDALRESLEVDLGQYEATGGDVRKARNRLPREPYRLKVALVALRLQRTAERPLFAQEATRPPLVYTHPDELRADLTLVREALQAGGYGRAAGLGLANVERMVDTFGFHLASIDLREDSLIIRAAARGILKVARVSTEPDTLEAVLTQEILDTKGVAPGQLALNDPDGAPVDAGDLELVRRLLAMLSLAGRAQHLQGERACHNLILTMASTPVDVLSALLLLKTQGLFRAHWRGGLREPDGSGAPVRDGR